MLQEGWYSQYKHCKVLSNPREIWELSNTHSVLEKGNLRRSHGQYDKLSYLISNLEIVQNLDHFLCIYILTLSTFFFIYSRFLLDLEGASVSSTVKPLFLAYFFTFECNIFYFLFSQLVLLSRVGK